MIGSAIAIGVTTPIYIIANTLNPNSYFCCYEIYKNGNSYEVWWNARTRHIEQTFSTYEQAKAFQKSKCENLLKFMAQSPSGSRIK